MTRHIAILTGAGISAESGLQTFRDGDGLWEGYNIAQVATPEAWQADPALVQRFYNERRAGILAAKPNSAHTALASLEEYFSVSIITQNIDNLHERAGSGTVVHLHGEITKSQSSLDPNLIYDIEGADLEMGELCELGSQLRPNVVWFGESVPMMENASDIVSNADIFLIAGTSLAVYPAASLLSYRKPDTPMYLVDPSPPAHLDERFGAMEITIEKSVASIGVPLIVERLIHSIG